MKLIDFDTQVETRTAPNPQSRNRYITVGYIPVLVCDIVIGKIGVRRSLRDGSIQYYTHRKLNNKLHINAQKTESRRLMENWVTDAILAKDWTTATITQLS